MTVHIQDVFSALFNPTPKPGPTTFGQLLRRQGKDLQHIKEAVELMRAYGVKLVVWYEGQGRMRLSAPNDAEGVSFWIRDPDLIAIQDFFERVCQTEGVAL